MQKGRLTMRAAIGHRKAPEAVRSDRGQILVVAAFAMVAMVAMAALVLEGGNAYAQQRSTQNGVDATANAGAVILAERLGGATHTDADVASTVAAFAAANGVSTQTAGLSTQTAYYTNITGQFLSTAGVVVADKSAAAVVGGGTIPSGAQGVSVDGMKRFATTFGRAIGFNSFDAGATATAVTGRLEGGAFIPVVFPINIVDCEQNGDIGVGVMPWAVSQPPASAGGTPVGQEYIVPLCRSGPGSFMILDLDPNKTCAEEISDPPQISWNLPTWVATDNGNDCAKKMLDGVNALHGKIVFIPVCDVACVRGQGSNLEYHIVKVAAFFLDPVTPMSDSNNPNNSMCQGGGGLTPIRGNGSSSCLRGWFINYITTGPVGAGTIDTWDSIGVQLIK